MTRRVPTCLAAVLAAGLLASAGAAARGADPPSPRAAPLPHAPAWPPRGEPVRVPIVRDTWLSSVGDEKSGSNGGAPRLKLKGQQEYTLFDIDPAPLKGRRVTGALWHVRTASPDAPLLRVTVSTLASPWVEGTATGYRRQAAASCFLQAETDKRDWAYPGGTLVDVAWGRGHTRWRFAEASAPDAGGWQAVAVEPDVVAARVAGLSHGFAAYDDVGSVWSYRGGKFAHTTFPNRFLHSRESRGSEPWLEVWTDGTDAQAPAAVADLAVSTADLPAGEALVTWATPPDAGGGRTLGFHVAYAAGDRRGDVPRYLVPMAGRPGEEVRMHLQDLGFGPGEAVALTVSPVDGAGNVGPPLRKTVRVSAEPAVFDLGPPPAEPFPPSEALPAVAGLKVAVVDLVDKVHSQTGRMIPDRPAGYKGGNHLWSAEGRRVRLHAARNEAVCFQVLLEGRAERAAAELRFADAPGLRAAVYRLDVVQTKAGPVPDVALPLAGEFAVPPKDDPESADAAVTALLVEVYVPRDAPAGPARGLLRLTADGASLDLAVDLAVWDFTLPDRLSFIPEMNAYGTADPVGNLAYYRVAHEHRLCLNRLYYGWNGAPRMAPRWTGDGFDFAQWDRQFGPLFDGSAFKDLPRAGEPVDVFYLPVSENWPMDVYAAYRRSYWADEALAPAYREGLKKALAAFAAHCHERGWHDTIFEFYLNNKVYYKRDAGWKGSSAFWIFDEPVGTQDFWALRWYGLAWQEAVGPARGKAKMWYRGDISYSQYGRDLLWGLLDLECLGGTTPQKVRLKRDEQVLSGRNHFSEYGSANDPSDPNVQPVLWCLKAWADGAVGVLPWQTIGKAENLRQGSPTGLFIPHGGGVAASVRLKAFRRGQQDVEVLTLAGETFGRPAWAVAAGAARLVSLAGQVRKTSEADAGTLRFAGADATALWRLRTAAGARVSAKRPPYRRCVRPMPTPEFRLDRLPDIGYVTVAPRLPPSGPDMD